MKNTSEVKNYRIEGREVARNGGNIIEGAGGEGLIRETDKNRFVL